jgi:hypothetical protein
MLRLFNIKNESLFSDFKNGSTEPEEEARPHRQRLRDQSQASYELLKDRNMDGLLIVCKQV